MSFDSLLPIILSIPMFKVDSLPISIDLEHSNVNNSNEKYIFKFSDAGSPSTQKEIGRDTANHWILNARRAYRYCFNKQQQKDLINPFCLELRRYKNCNDLKQEPIQLFEKFNHQTDVIRFAKSSSGQKNIHYVFKMIMNNLTLVSSPFLIRTQESCRQEICFLDVNLSGKIITVTEFTQLRQAKKRAAEESLSQSSSETTSNASQDSQEIKEKKAKVEVILPVDRYTSEAEKMLESQKNQQNTSLQSIDVPSMNDIGFSDFSSDLEFSNQLQSIASTNQTLIDTLQPENKEKEDDNSNY